MKNNWNWFKSCKQVSVRTAFNGSFKRLKKRCYFIGQQKYYLQVTWRKIIFYYVHILSTSQTNRLISILCSIKKENLICNYVLECFIFLVSRILFPLTVSQSNIKCTWIENHTSSSFKILIHIGQALRISINIYNYNCTHVLLNTFKRIIMSVCC